MVKKFLVILGTTLVLLFAGFKFISEKSKNTNISDAIKRVVPSPTPFLFEDITIPYIRGRDYKSSLGELKQYAEGADFTTYLTSYTSDNLKINALITKPKGEVPPGGFPAIVFVHGYIAPTIYKTTERYIDYVNYLARNGFVVFKIDLRGHGDSEGQPTGSYYSGDYVIDTLNAYSALENSEFVNPKKVGLWGHSMGGNVTLRSFVVKKDIPAIVIWAGAGYTYTDLLTYRINDQSYRPPTTNTESSKRRRLLNETYGTFNPESWFWKQVPPVNYLDGVAGAIQVHHAVDDPTVSVEYSRNLMKVLDSSSIPHTLYEYNSGGHNISGSSFSTAMQRTVEFYKKNFNTK